MGIINYSAPRRLLTIARGHPYERDAFAGLFTGLEEFDTCHIEQPLAQQVVGVKTAQEYDALVCYDMPGIDFTASEDPPRLVAPEPDFIADFIGMLEEGIGIVFMHHAIAAWPAWPQFAEIIGGRFHYRSANLRAAQWPDSGYRHKITHTVSIEGNHPITEGLPDSFEITDELYLCPIFENDVIPLLRSNYNFVQENFYSAAAAIKGDMNTNAGWQHPAGSNLVGWVKKWGKSPIVYLQGGDDSVAMQNPHFIQLLHNAVRWVSSEEAHAWASGESDGTLR